MAAPAPSEADETTVSLLDVAAPVDDAPNSETPPPKTRRLYVLVDWRHRDRAFDVLATDGDGARAWRGTAREPANAPFPDWHERAVMALAGIDASERFAFEFAFGDDDGALRWRWHEAAGAQISNAATTTISTPPPPPARVAAPATAKGARRVGQVTLKLLAPADALARHVVGRVLCAYATQQTSHRRKIIRATRDAAAREEEARETRKEIKAWTDAKDAWEREYHRKVARLMNSKKAELRRLDEALEAARDENDALRARVESGGGGRGGASSDASSDDDGGDEGMEDTDDEREAMKAAKAKAAARRYAEVRGGGGARKAKATTTTTTTKRRKVAGGASAAATDRPTDPPPVAPDDDATATLPIEGGGDSLRTGASGSVLDDLLSDAGAKPSQPQPRAPPPPPPRRLGGTRATVGNPVGEGGGDASDDDPLSLLNPTPSAAATSEVVETQPAARQSQQTQNAGVAGGGKRRRGRQGGKNPFEDMDTLLGDF